MKILILHMVKFFGSLVYLQSELESLPELGPIMEPEAISFSFETPGWYILAVLLPLIIIFLFFKWLKKYFRNAYRRNALKEIERIQQDNLDETKLDRVLVLLRITAIEAYGRNQVASIYGNDWVEFLDSKVDKSLFSKYSDFIADFVYKGILSEKNEIQEIINSSKKWIKTHA